MGTEQRSVKYPTHSPYSDLPFRFGLGILGGPGTNPTNEDSISDTKTSLDSVSHGSSPNVNSFQKDRRYISYQIVFFTLIDLWVNPPTPSGPRVIPSLLSTYLWPRKSIPSPYGLLHYHSLSLLPPWGGVVPKTEITDPYTTVGPGSVTQCPFSETRTIRTLWKLCNPPLLCTVNCMSRSAVLFSVPTSKSQMSTSILILTLVNESGRVV